MRLCVPLPGLLRSRNRDRPYPTCKGAYSAQPVHRCSSFSNTASCRLLRILKPSNDTNRKSYDAGRNAYVDTNADPNHCNVNSHAYSAPFSNPRTYSYSSTHTNPDSTTNP